MKLQLRSIEVLYRTCIEHSEENYKICHLEAPFPTVQASHLRVQVFFVYTVLLDKKD